MNDINQDTPIEEKPVDEVEVPVSDSVKAFLGEEPTETEKEQDIPTSEDKPQEGTVLEVETPKKEVEEPEIPLEEIVEEVKAKTKDEVKADILKALGMSEEEKEVAEEQGYKFPWEARGEEAPKDWKEVIDASIEYQNFKKEEESKVQVEKQKEELAVIQAREVEINTEWNSQLDYLRSEGLIPQVAPEITKKIEEGKTLTLQEREDAGLKAQAQIFQSMYELSLERDKQGLPPITDVVHIYSRFFKKTEKPSGADAPVSGGNVPIQSNDDDDIPYDELHGAADFESLIK